MTKNKNHLTPSLTEKESSGGEHNDKGISFQANVTLSWIPEWLAQDSFSAMIREAIGDTEAKFFKPGYGDWKEFIEVKNHTLTPAEFWREIDRFKRVDTGSPGTYNKFTLAITGLSPDIQPLINILNRVRKPDDFYEDGSGVKINSFSEYLEKVQQLQRTEADAHFIFEKVFIRADLSIAQTHGEVLFQQSLTKHLPEYKELLAKSLSDIHNNLYIFVKNRINQPITRLELEATLREKINLPKTRPIMLHTASTEEKTRHNLAISFEWQKFFGGNTRCYPPTEEWNTRLIGELKQTQEFILQNHKTRRIKLTGNHRLSASLAIGSIFSAVSGFIIDMEYRNEIWSTDAHPTSQTPPYVLEPTIVNKTGKQIIVTIGILRDIKSEVTTNLKQHGLKNLPILHLEAKEALISAEQVNLAVRNCKNAIDKALVDSGAQLIHLFIASPAHFALFLGHRLNATAAVQCYEWVSTEHYVPTCRLSC